ncbi:MAG TPA: RsmE family RNA methyltransferase [Gemmatimonadales bacterium]|nr:RsmE family RNA methyltransferase [Gemmatimonadales bacterium]
MIVLVQTERRTDGRTVGLLDGEEHHLRVRRAREGEIVGLRDGTGLVGTGRLVRVGKGWAVEVARAAVGPRPPALRVAVGAGDRERFAWLVEKAAELGVTDLHPLDSANAAAVATRVRHAQLERLRRRALEATKQCGAAWAPVVHTPEPLAGFVARRFAGERWLADVEGDAPPPPPAGELTVIVGPEGGLTADERSLALAAGYRAVRLGAHTLRFETAALAAAALAAAGRLTGTGGSDG